MEYFKSIIRSTYFSIKNAAYKILYWSIFSLNWSSLSRIGNSRVSKLTILMPVIGYLVLFNTELTQILSITIPNFSEEQVSGFWGGLYERNLVFLYFGLLFFGAGVGLYTVFAPAQIRDFPEIQNYIATMESIRTRNLVIERFEKVIGFYLVNLRGEEKSPFFENQNLSFPTHVRTYLFRLVNECFSECCRNDATDETEIDAEDFRTGSGYIKTDEIIETIYSGNRVSEIFRDEILSGIVGRPKDVFHLEHLALEYYKPWVRVLVAVFYGVGLLLLLIPTIATSALILENW